MSDHPPTLDHIEKAFADAYRKEIDQEENVWRTLPFFAATLALQLAALFQIIERLPDRLTTAWWLAGILGAATGGATFVGLCFLALSIYPAKFRYIAPEPELLVYANGLIQDENEQFLASEDERFSAIATLKTSLARQYADAVHHNRLINHRRAKWRSVAGLATLASVITTLALVVTIMLSYAPKIH